MAAGTSLSPAIAGAGGFVSGLFQPMGEDRLRMGLSPAIGKHLFQT
jgi:hypothetical protein